MRFNFNNIITQPCNKSVELVSASNFKHPPASTLGFSGFSNNFNNANSFFARFSLPASPDELIGTFSHYSDRNTYLFDYTSRRNALMGGRFFHPGSTSLYEFYNASSSTTRALSGLLLTRAISYFNYSVMFFRSYGFRSGSFRISIFSRVGNRDSYLFYFFRFLSFNAGFFFATSPVFFNRQFRIKNSISFFYFFVNFFNIFKKSNFSNLNSYNRQFFSFKSKRKIRFNPLYFYFFYNYLGSNHPAVLAKVSFFNFYSFYLGEFIHFNNAFYVRKFVAQNSAIFLQTTY